MKLKYQVSAMIAEDVVRYMHKVKEKTGRSIGSQVNDALQDWYSKSEEKQ